MKILCVTFNDSDFFDDSCLEIFSFIENLNKEAQISSLNFGGDKKGQWQFELKGEYAAQGKIKGAVMRKLLTAAKFKNIPDESNFNDCKPDAKQAAKITNDSLFIAATQNNGIK